MSTLSKLVIELRTGLRKIADDLENHEAVAESAIAKLKGLRAKTTVEASRLQWQAHDLQARIETTDREIADWRDWAKRTAAADETKALECVRRLNQFQRQRAGLASDLDNTLSLTANIQQDLEAMDRKLRELQRRRASFVTREALAQATLGGIAKNSLDDATEAVFERWEQRILIQETQMPTESASRTDRFADDFRREEENVHLRDLLKTIVNSEESAS